MNTNIEMTPKTEGLWRSIVGDLGNWGGDCTPCYNHLTKELRGNLTDLKKRGFVKTFFSNGEEWIILTETGTQLAKEQGLLQ